MARILLVEDDAMVRKGTNKVLLRAGHEVWVYDSLEAYHKAVQFYYRLVTNAGNVPLGEEEQMVEPAFGTNLEEEQLNWANPAQNVAEVADQLEAVEQGIEAEFVEKNETITN